jgi:hypothetical protein
MADENESLKARIAILEVNRSESQPFDQIYTKAHESADSREGEVEENLEDSGERLNLCHAIKNPEKDSAGFNFSEQIDETQAGNESLNSQLLLQDLLEMKEKYSESEASVSKLTLWSTIFDHFFSLTCLYFRYLHFKLTSLGFENSWNMKRLHIKKRVGKQLNHLKHCVLVLRTI